MFTTERITRAAMMHELDEEAVDRALDIAFAVERSMVCPFSKRVLDSRTAVGIWHAGKFTGVAVDPEWAKETAEKVLGGLYTLRDAADVWKVIK